MNNDMFQKLAAGKRNVLEYKLMSYYYREDMDDNRKISFMFEQFADTLKDIAHNNSYCKQDDNMMLTPEQVDNIVSCLGGLFLEYNMKVQGRDLYDCFSAALDDLISDIKDQEDNENE